MQAIQGYQTNFAGGTATRAEKESLLDSLARELFEESHRRFRLLYPWVLVRVLSKAGVTKGGIVLPPEQNKTTHEGIVLQTWVPSDKHEGKLSELLPGDHVIFPHWSGLPLEGFDKQKYRVVREDDWKEDKDGGIFSVIEYDGMDARPHVRLKELLHKELDCRQAGDLDRVDQLVAKIVDHFLVVDREMGSVTLSGR